jgi:hypothetical protein
VIARCDFGDELRPTAALDGVLIGIRNWSDVEREDEAPGGFDAVDVVAAVAPQNAFDVNDRNLQIARDGVKSVHAVHHLARPRRGTRTVRRIGQMNLMKID